jgi:hypothetical protein
MSRNHHQGHPTRLRIVLKCRANDARRYDAQYGSIIIVRRITFHLGIMPVQPVRQPGKNIYQWERQPVPIEVDEEVRINSEEAGEVNPPRRIEGLVRVLHLVRGVMLRIGRRLL